MIELREIGYSGAPRLEIRSSAAWGRGVMIVDASDEELLLHLLMERAIGAAADGA